MVIFFHNNILKLKVFCLSLIRQCCPENLTPSHSQGNSAAFKGFSVGVQLFQIGESVQLLITANISRDGVFISV